MKRLLAEVFAEPPVAALVAQRVALAEPVVRITDDQRWHFLDKTPQHPWSASWVCRGGIDRDGTRFSAVDCPAKQHYYPAEIKFELDGKAGETLWVARVVDRLFVGRKLLADDTASRQREGTLVVDFLYGGERRFGEEGKKPTTYFHHPLGSGTYFPQCPSGSEIAFEVEFLEDCTWTCILLGLAE